MGRKKIRHERVSLDERTGNGTIRDALLAERQRTNIGGDRLLNGAMDIPHRLTPTIVNQWLSGAIKTAPKEHIDYALKRWRSFPSAHERVKIAPELRRTLRAYMRQKGIGPSVLLRGRKDTPDGLNAGVVAGWLSGDAKSARKDYLEFVLARWSEYAPDPRTEISAQVRCELGNEKQRTGVGARRLLKHASDAPEDLTSFMVDGWISGQTVHARKDHLEYVLALWKSLPDEDEAYVYLTPERRNWLKDQKKRTGIGIYKLLKDADDAPTGLEPRTYHSWFNTRTKRANATYFNYVAERYKALPNAKPTKAPKQNYQVRYDRPDLHRIPPEALEELRTLRDKTGVGPTALLRGASDKPDGLTTYMISSWLGGQAKSARQDHLDYVLKRWESLASKKPVKS